MRPGRAAAALALWALLGGAARAENRVFSATGIRAEVQGVLDSAARQLDMRFVTFDDPGLLHCAQAAVSRGARVRLILGRWVKANRLAAPGLRQLGVQIRWAPKGEARYVVADGARAALGSFDGSTASMDSRQESVGILDDPALCADFSRQFELEWKGLEAGLPRRIILKDELEALPDPRENAPRVQTKRRNP